MKALTIGKIKNAVNSVSLDEPMSLHTYYKIGGPAKIFVSPKNINELKNVIEVCSKEKISYFLLGKGSNILVSDEGYDGCVIDMTGNMTKVKAEGEIIYAEAGTMMSKIAKTAEKNSLTGFEELSGIPGTLGGALVMNAGCYDSEISEKVSCVNILSDGQMKRIERKVIEFGYRRSSLKGSIILSAEILLSHGDKSSITAKMKEFNLRRKKSQPLNLPSCGSVFKRPLNNYTGKLIEECGLKGKTIGGAMVSELHAGFIVNAGGATAKDVLTLIRLVQREVYARFKVRLEEEVIFLGFKEGDLL